MRTDKAGKWISDIEYKIVKTTEAEKSHEYRFKELCISSKRNEICTVGVPEEETEQGAKGLFKQIIAENFLNLWKETDIKIQEP